MPPDFLAVGHIVKDVDGAEWRLGGSVAYAALQAARLGQSVACVTACGSDLDPVENLGWAEWRVVPGPDSTTFENRQREGRRVQRVLSLASPIAIDDIPEDWWHARTVFLCPVMGEVMPDVGEIAAPSSLLGIGCQGWLRTLRATRVEAIPFERRPPWLHGDVAFLSEEDIAQPERAADWSKHVPYVVLTRGRHGATIWNEGSVYRLPAYPAKVVDETGAGDVFASAFLVRFHETRDPIESGRFAAAAASLSVQGEGLKRIGTRDEIEFVLRSYPWAVE